LNNSRLPIIVTTITPQRISFAGGGTDILSFSRDFDGAVLSSTIDKYIYVTVKQHSPLFGESYRLSYFKTEHANSLDEIENEIIRECLRLVPVSPPLYISTTADVPASSGLGSSSSFAVGILNALHAMRGEIVSPGQLAEEACRVEINILNKPIGKQDQYAAAFGGLNFITFNKNGRVTIDQITLPENGVNNLFDNLMLVWTGVQRDAGEILKEQLIKADINKESLYKIRELAFELRDKILDHPVCIKQFGEILHKSWIAKQKLSTTVSNSKIDELYEKALNLGCYGGKLAGAGGGGFILLVAPPFIQKKIQNEFNFFGAIKIKHEPLGSRIIFKM